MAPCARLAILAAFATLSVACDFPGTSSTTDGGGSVTPLDGGMSGVDGPPAGQVFPSDNAWNRDISSEPVDPGSAAYIASIGATKGMHQDFSSVAGGNYGIPYIVVPGNQALVPITFTEYPEESDDGPYPIPPNAPIEAGGDGHVIVVDFDNGWLYELYQGKKTGNNWSAANGAKFNLRSGAGRTPGWTSADAAGLPIFAGLVRYDEVAAGEIKHALRFTINRSQKGYVAPASHAAGSTTAADAPPMGLRLRLKASFDTSSFGPQAKVILAALKKYGMIVADNGSDLFLSGSPHANWDDDDIADISRVKGADFEVIKHGAITAYP